MDLFGQPATQEEADAVQGWASVLSSATEAAAYQNVTSGEAHLPCTELVTAHMWCMAKFLAMHPQIQTEADAVDAGMAMGLELVGLILATKAAIRQMGGLPKNYRVEERDGPANLGPASCGVPKNKQN